MSMAIFYKNFKLFRALPLATLCSQLLAVVLEGRLATFEKILITRKNVGKYVSQKFDSIE